MDGDFLSDDILGLFNPPGEDDAGEGYFNRELLGGKNFENLEPGSFGFLVILHEIGHGLGLAHPHDEAGGSNLYPGLYSSIAPESSLGIDGLNQGIWTVMSYNDGFDGAGRQGSPMSFDIAAIQHLYGENPDFAAGNNTYTLPIANGSDTYYQSIWDTSGVDRLVAPADSQTATIDLRPAALVGSDAGGYISTVDGIDGGFTIANGVEIENASGSSGNDELTGNQLANRLVGNGGDDLLTGGEASDTLVGGAGNDTLTGIDSSGFSFGSGEYDTLRGGAGADDFILGDRDGSYYEGRGYATITDFDPLENDIIQLFGSSDDYMFEQRNNGTFIRENKDAVGFVVGEQDLSNRDIRFV